ncbi:methylosome protein WDR77-like [Ylistrum balloti]|uniref:methylosome protein WDR77-like n=1 Tax=Ylistrum balloti TaxID=509963 RepID=UPI0029059065|nr:methylosome protein WDR77-like [Ylistrum balloti]
MDNIPAAMDRHLDVIQCHEDGGILLGASNLTGRYWYGSIWYYQDPSCAPDVEKCKAGVQLEAGLSDALWLSSTKVLVGLDTGGLAVWELIDDFDTFMQQLSTVEHDDIVSSISICSDKQRAISGSHDRCVKVWDLETLASRNTYRAHGDLVNCVKCHPTESAIFLSCSQDGSIFLWDTRKPKPVSIVDKSPLQHSSKCVVWQPNSQHSFAVGDETGQIVVKDTRMSIGTPVTYTAHCRCVNRLEFSRDSPSLLASVSDDCEVVITDTSSVKCTEVYRNRSHRDFVQGLSWKGNQIFTCGWDSQVLTHTIDNVAMTTSGTVTIADKVKGQTTIGDMNCKVETSMKDMVKCNGNGDSMSVEST